MRNVEEQKTYFGMALSERGILPVWVTMANKSSRDSYQFDSQKITVMVQGRAVGIAQKARNPINMSGADALGAVSSLLVSPIGMLAYGMMQTTNEEIKRNIVVKQLYSKTIGASERNIGFLYVPYDAAKMGQGGGIVRLTLDRSPPADGQTGTIVDLPY